MTVKNGDPMSNGKKFNRTVTKYSDKRMSNHLFNIYPKVDETKVYETKHKLKGEHTGRYMAVIAYSPKNFVNCDELDIFIRRVYRDGQEVKLNNAEIEELYSAALNDYFLNHAA